MESPLYRRRDPLPPKAMVGMVHLHALPGTPKCSKTIDQIVAVAVQEAVLLEECGFDAIILENMHDTPYLNREAAVCTAVRRAVKIPIGIQVLAGANKAALAVALAGGASFVRCEGFVFSHVADEGIMNSDAGELLRYRRAINADHIAVFCDIKKKHSAHAITSDVTIGQTAEAAHFFCADGVIVTGVATGQPASVEDVRQARAAVPPAELKVLVGSGITPTGLADVWHHADAFICGTYLKCGGRWENPLDRAKCLQIIEAAHRLRAMDERVPAS